jgi:PPOX class probable FMN-dependent enzyme
MAHLTEAPDPHRLDTLDAVREVIGEPIPGLDLKVTGVLGDEVKEFIARSPFLVLSTADAEGNVDASPKGDEPGFVVVEDDETLVVPDRPGNKLVYGLTNIVDNSHVGILFMIPGTNETVRVNGRAELTADPELLERLAARGKPATLAIRVHVDQCFYHCAKAFIRSKLWKPDTWPENKKISFGKMFAQRVGVEGDDAAKLADDIDARVEEDYVTNL